jgi:methylthioribose-1-phosphate isomerase
MNAASGAERPAVPPTLCWIGDVDGYLRLLDQTQLPRQLVFCDCRRVEEVWEAIRCLRVRGAPAIGLAAAYGVVLGMQPVGDDRPQEYAPRLHQVLEYLRSSRPTAVNLFWALERLEACIHQDLGRRPPSQLTRRLLEEAWLLEEEDRRVCRAIGHWGAPLVPEGGGVLTHCNAGALATADYGTALAVLFTAAEQGRRFRVYVDETRPLLQGARLTTWELQQRGLETILICDSMAAQVMKEKRVQLVLTGADRIAANGDTANKIGTYGLAVLARAHGIPFYVAAPSSTFDLRITDGMQIPIEQRDPREITHGLGGPIAPEGIAVYNPAFDVTPAEWITGIITEKGIIQPVTPERIRAVLAAPAAE